MLQIALLLQSDPSTCDTAGHRGTGGYYLKQRLDLSDGRADWATDGPLPYRGSETIRRFYFYMLGPSASFDQIQQHNDDGQKEPKYPGMLNIPQNLQRLSTFAVTPGETILCRPTDR